MPSEMQPAAFDMKRSVGEGRRSYRGNMMLLHVRHDDVSKNSGGDHEAGAATIFRLNGPGNFS